MLTLAFTVRDPIGINAFYMQPKGQKRRIVTSDGRAFKHRIQAAAAVARFESEWPSDPFRVARARVSYQLYDSRLDTDAPRKVLRDALEGVLYVNDRVVDDGPAPLPVRDGAGRRVVVTVELLEVRTEFEADRERVRHHERALKNVKRRAQAARKRTVRKGSDAKCGDCNGTGIVIMTNSNDAFGEPCKCAA